MAASKSSFSGFKREPAFRGLAGARVPVSALARTLPSTGRTPKKNSKTEERK